MTYTIHGHLLHACEIIAKHGDLQVGHCQVCGYAHLTPLPHEGHEADLYDEHSPRDWFMKEEDENRRGLWKSTYNRWLAAMRLWPNPKVCDVGAGTGWFIQHLWEHRPDIMCVGIEPSDAAREQAPARWRMVKSWDELDMNVSDESDPNWIGSYQTLPKTNFDGVVVSLVLEHLIDPRKLLKEVNGRMKVGGSLVVVVPNEFNALQMLAAKRRPAWWISPVHVNYFTPHTLGQLLERHGFKVVRQWNTFPMELFLLLGFDYIRNPILGRKLHRLRLRLDPVMGLLYRVLPLFNIGREVCLVAIKEASCQ